MDRLKGKVAIVTGAALGLGRATAVRMAEEGAAVALLDLHDEQGRALAEELGKRGQKARYWRCDVSREAEVAKVFGEVASAFGRLDVLVNNAGIAGANKPTDQLTEAEWDLVQAINVKGVFFGVKHAVPHLRKRPGCIVNNSSIQAFDPSDSLLDYAASKAAINNFTVNLAAQLGPDGVRVNAVAPGPMRTPLQPATQKTEKVQHFGEDTPLGRAGRCAQHAFKDGVCVRTGNGIHRVEAHGETAGKQAADGIEVK